MRNGITRLDFAFIALVCLLILGIALCARAEKPQLTLAIYGRTSIKEVRLTEKTTFECLTKSDGKPDLKQCHLTHYVVDLNGDFTYGIQ